MTQENAKWPNAGWRVVSNSGAWASAAAAALLLGLAGCRPAAAPPEVVQAVKVQAVGASAIVHVGEYAGVVAARTETRLGFRVAGKLTERAVGVGDAVKAGQLLAQLDAQDYQLSAAAGQAQVTAALTQRDLAQADVARYRALREQNFISAAEMDRREASLKGAQAALDQARAQLSAQRNQAGYTRLIAEGDGIITGVDAEVGQVVSAGATVLRFARGGERDAVFSVPEDQRSQFAVGTPVQVRVWASGAEIEGRVRELSASADPVSRTFTVKVALLESSPQLPPIGATVAVQQRTTGRPSVQALKLPISAVFEKQGATRVWVLDRASMQLHARDVALGGMDQNEVVLTSGLKPGDEVVVAGVHVLSEGQKVRVYQPKGEEVATPATAVGASGAPADLPPADASSAAVVPAGAAQVPASAAVR